MDKKSRAKFDGLSFQIKAEENPNQESMIGLDDLDLEDVQLKPLSVKIMVKSDKKKVKDQPFAFIPKSSGNSPTRMGISDDKFDITTSAQTLVNFGVVVGNTPCAAARTGRKGCLDPPFDVDPRAYEKSKVNKIDADPAPSVAFSGLLHKKKSKENEETQNISILDNVPITTLFDRRSSLLDNKTPKTEIRDEMKAMRSVAKIEKFITEPMDTEKEDNRINRFPINDEQRGFDRRPISEDINNELQPFFGLESKSMNMEPYNSDVEASDSTNSLEYRRARIEEEEEKQIPIERIRNNEQGRNCMSSNGSGIVNVGMVAAAGAVIATNGNVPFQDIDKKRPDLTATLNFSEDNKFDEHSNSNISRNNAKGKDLSKSIVSRASATGHPAVMLQSDTISNKNFPSQDPDKMHADQAQKSPFFAPKDVHNLSNKPSHAKCSSQHSNTGVVIESERQATFQIEYNLPEPFLVTKVVLSAINTSTGVDETITKLRSPSSHLENGSAREENGIEKPPIKENISRTDIPIKTDRKETNIAPELVKSATAMAGAGLGARKHLDPIKHNPDEKIVNPDVSASALDNKIDTNLPKECNSVEQGNLNRDSPVNLSKKNVPGIQKSNRDVINPNISASLLEPNSYSLQKDEPITQNLPEDQLGKSNLQMISVKQISPKKEQFSTKVSKDVTERLKYSFDKRLSETPVFPFLAKDIEPMQGKDEISVNIVTDNSGLQNQSKTNNVNVKELLEREKATRRTDTIKMVNEEEAMGSFENSRLQSEKSSFLRQENMDCSLPSGILSQNSNITSRETETNTQRSSPSRLQSPSDFTYSEIIRSRPSSVIKSDVQKQDSPLHPYMAEILDLIQQGSPGKKRSADLNNSSRSVISSENSDNKIKRQINKSKQNSLPHNNVEGQSQTVISSSQIVSPDTENKYKAQYRSSRSGVLNLEMIGRPNDLNKIHHSTQEAHTNRSPSESVSPHNTLRYVVHENTDESLGPNITLSTHTTTGQGGIPRSHNSPTKETESAKHENRNRSFQNQIFNEELTRNPTNIKGIQELLASRGEGLTRMANSIGRHSPQKEASEHKPEDRHRSPEHNVMNNDLKVQSDNLNTAYMTNSRQKTSRDSSQFSRVTLSSLKVSDPLNLNQMDIGEVSCQNMQRMFRNIAATVDDDGDEDKNINSDTLNLPQDQPEPKESITANNQWANNQDEEKKMNNSDELNEENKLDMLKNPTDTLSTKLFLNLAFRNTVVDDVWMLQSIDPDDEDEMANKENLSVISAVVTHSGYINRIPINHKRDAILSLHGKDIPEDITMLLKRFESELHDTQNCRSNFDEIIKEDISEENVYPDLTVQDPITVVNLSFKRNYSSDNDIWMLKTIDTKSAVAAEDTFIFIKNPLALQEYITIPINEENTALIIFRNNESIEATRQIEKEENNRVTNDQDNQDTSNKNSESKTEQPDEAKLDLIKNPLLLNLAFRNSIVDDVWMLQSIDPDNEDEMADKENLFVISDVITHTGCINRIPINNIQDAILSLHRNDIPENINMLLNTLESELLGKRNSGKTDETLQELTFSTEALANSAPVVKLSFKRSYSPNDKTLILKTIDTKYAVSDKDTFIFIKNPLGLQEYITIPINEENSALIIFRNTKSVEPTKQIEEEENKGVADDVNDQHKEEKPIDADSIRLSLNLAFRNLIVNGVSMLQSIDWNDDDEMADKKNLFVISDLITQTGCVNRIPINDGRDAILSLHGKYVPEDITMLLNKLESELRDKKNSGSSADGTSQELNVSTEKALANSVTVVKLSFKRSYSPIDKTWTLKTIDTKYAVSDKDTFIFIKNPLGLQEYITIPINEENSALIIFRNTKSVEPTKQIEEEENKGVADDVNDQHKEEKPIDADSIRLSLNLAFRNLIVNGVSMLQSIDWNDDDEMADKKNLFVISDLITQTGCVNRIPINDGRDAILSLHGKYVPEDITMLLNKLGSELRDKKNSGSSADGTSQELNVSTEKALANSVTVVKLSFKRSYSPIDKTWTLKTIDTKYAVADKDTFIFIKDLLGVQEYITIPINEENSALIIFRNINSVESTKQIEKEESKGVADDVNDQCKEEDPTDADSIRLLLNLAFRNLIVNGVSMLQSIDWNDEDEMADKKNLIVISDLITQTGCVNKIPINDGRDAILSLHGKCDPEDITMLLNKLESELRDKKNSGSSADGTSQELNVSTEKALANSVTVVKLSFKRSYSPNDKTWILKTIDTKYAVADKDTFIFIKNPLGLQEYITIPINEENSALIIFRNIDLTDSNTPIEKEECEGITEEVHLDLGFKLVYNELTCVWTLVTFNPDEKDDSDSKKQIIKDTLYPNADYSHTIKINPGIIATLLIESAKRRKKEEDKNIYTSTVKDLEHATEPNVPDKIIGSDKTKADVVEKSIVSHVDLVFRYSFSEINNMITLQTVDCVDYQKTDKTYLIKKPMTDDATLSTIPLTNNIEATIYFKVASSCEEIKDTVVDINNKDIQPPKINLSLAFNQRPSENDDTFTLQSLDPSNLRDDTIIVTKNDIGIGTLCVFPINKYINIYFKLKKIEKKPKAKSSGSIRILDAKFKNQPDLTPEDAALVEIDFEGEDVLIKGSQFRDVNMETFPADANFPSNFVTSLYKEVHKTRVNAKNQELTLSIDAEKHEELCIEIVSDGRTIKKFLQPGGSPVLCAHAGKRITFQLKETDSDDGKSCNNIKKDCGKTIPNMRICRCHKKKT